MKRVLATVSPVSWMLIAVCVPLTAVGMELAVGDPDGDTWWGYSMVALPSIVGAYAVLEVTWRRLPEDHNRLWESFRVLLLVPTVAGVVTGAVVGVAYPLLDAGRRALEVDPSGYHSWYRAEDGNPWALSMFGGIGIGMFVALGVFMCVAAPLLAFLRPGEFVEANYGLEPDDAGYPAAVAAVRGIAILAACAFLGPGAFVLGQPLAGWVVVGVAVLLIAWVWRTQRRIHEAD